ncbi:MAG TPA: sigma-54 dependent transcriptional regulator [Candidatus Eisenbacteria bacterium]|nr:sigma-54 dependent transcriptional regulator [Candidatus Eisenbacteria bacterium]
MNSTIPETSDQTPRPPRGFGRSPNLLVVEPNGEIASLLRARFASAISLDTAGAEAVPHHLKTAPYDLLIWAVEAFDGPHLVRLEELLKLISLHSPRTQLIVISEREPEPVGGRGNRRTYQYIPRPYEPEKLCKVVEVALERRPVSQSLLAYPEFRVLAEFEGMIGISLPMREVFQRIIEASSADIPVLITGETGTGKDLVAAAIHNRSERKHKPYIPVNTGAIAPELIAAELFGHEKGAYTGAVERRRGFFEQADGGTIFLDEISTMDEKTQVGLLRVLENKTFRRVRGDRDIKVDVRVIAATNEDLEEAIGQKRFREDLYYRLDVFRIHLPPLRERPGGVTLLTNHFVIVFNSLYNKQVKSIAPEVYRCLRRYRWPGNVRELKNVIQRAVLMAKGEEITLDLIPPRIREAAQAGEQARAGRLPFHPGMTLAAAEKELITMTLAATGGNKKEAARQLGISRRALYNKLSKYRLLQ